MDEVVESVKRVTDIMGEISAASTEQSQGIEQVNKAVSADGPDDAAERRPGARRSRPTESLQDQARSLAEALGAFRLDESGPAAEPGPAARAAIERASARPAETTPALRAASRRPKDSAVAAEAITT